MKKLTFHPLTPNRWPDLARLFGERGACGGCWCMAWRLKRSEFLRQKGAGNKKAFRAIVASGAVPGVLAYHKGRPIAWCAIEPREKYPVLENSRILKRVDDKPVWSVVCFFVEKAFRRKGVSAQIIEAAAEFARASGARLVEGYPNELKKDLPDAFIWTGLASAFRRAGFVEVARRSRTRPIMRMECGSLLLFSERGACPAPASKLAAQKAAASRRTP